MKESVNFHEKPDEGFGNSDKYELGDIRFLFDKNRPTALAEKIKAKGYKILEDFDEGEERITKIDLSKGEHLFGFGFRQINPKEKRWFHGGLDDKERRESSSFKFDTKSPEFEKIFREYVSNISANDNLEDVVARLNTVLQRHVRSDMGEENAHSLSEIIQAKKAACASKSVLAGSMLKEQFPDLRVEVVDGYYGVVKDKISLPFGHEWLRISDGDSCVLYDPMYDKRFYYKFDTHPNSGNPFSNYTVSALPFAQLHNLIKLTTVGGSLKLAESHIDSGREFLVENEHTINCQLGGQIAAYAKTDGGVLKLVDGNISNEVQAESGPRLLYPLIALEKAD